MLPLQLFRKPYLAVFLASLLLFVSCNQYDFDSTNRSFDYSAAIFAKENNISYNVKKYTDLNLSRTSISEVLNQILYDANSIYETSIEIPDEALLLAFEDSIQEKGLELGYILNEDISLSNSLEANISNIDFQTALSVFEDEVHSMDLSKEEFKVYNDLANILQIAQDNNVSILDSQINNRSVYKCLLALVSLGIAYARLGMCNPARGYSCLYAVYYVIMGILAVSANCEK